MFGKRIRAVLPVVVIICLLFTNLAAAAPPDNYFETVMGLITRNFPEAVSQRQLVEAALAGMFSGLDPYTEFYPNTTAAPFLQSLEGSYVGIGVTLLGVGGAVYITGVSADSPAARAGLLPGDRLLSVDDTPLEGNMALATTCLREETGSAVRLRLHRDGLASPLTVEVNRAPIAVNPVRTRTYRDTGYIALTMFNAHAGDSIAAALREMDRLGIGKIILDLRDNPGGDVAQAVDVARQLVPEGIITVLAYTAEGSPDTVYNSYLPQQPYQMVVLVNGGTASAAEILTGAIQDRGVGKIIGTQTYGKSRFQIIFPLLTPEAYAQYRQQYGSTTADAVELAELYSADPGEADIIGWVKLTAGHYLTPSGRRLDGRGIVPDITATDSGYRDELQGLRKLRQIIKPNLGDESLDVYYAEKILQLSGYTVDEPDGVMDRTTFQAIWDFQADASLSPYGVLDFATQRAFNDKLDSLFILTDQAYTKALEELSIGS